MLRGNAPATIDEKGRLKIPSAFRAHIEESWGSDFYVTSLSGESVLVYPLPIWQEIEERLAKLPSLNPTKKKFLDRTNFYGQETTADKSGRILIPPPADSHFFSASPQECADTLAKFPFMTKETDENMRRLELLLDSMPDGGRAMLVRIFNTAVPGLGTALTEPDRC